MKRSPREHCFGVEIDGDQVRAGDNQAITGGALCVCGQLARLSILTIS